MNRTSDIRCSAKSSIQSRVFLDHNSETLGFYNMDEHVTLLETTFTEDGVIILLPETC